MNDQYRYMRLVRTESSEVYVIWQGEERAGQLELHYAGDMIHGTLILERKLEASQEERLVAEIDQTIVSSYRPSYEREDFLVTVYAGRELGTYTDAQNDVKEEESDGLT